MNEDTSTRTKEIVTKGEKRNFLNRHLDDIIMRSWQALPLHLRRQQLLLPDLIGLLENERQLRVSERDEAIEQIKDLKDDLQAVWDVVPRLVPEGGSPLPVVVASLVSRYEKLVEEYEATLGKVNTQTAFALSGKLDSIQTNLLSVLERQQDSLGEIEDMRDKLRSEQEANTKGMAALRERDAIIAALWAALGDLPEFDQHAHKGLVPLVEGVVKGLKYERSVNADLAQRFDQCAKSEKSATADKVRLIKERDEEHSKLVIVEGELERANQILAATQSALPEYLWYTSVGLADTVKQLATNEATWKAQAKDCDVKLRACAGQAGLDHHEIERLRRIEGYAKGLAESISYVGLDQYDKGQWRLNGERLGEVERALGMHKGEEAGK